MQRCSQDKTSQGQSTQVWALSAPALCHPGDMQTPGTLSHEMAKSTVIAIIQPRFGQSLFLAVLSWQERLCKKLRLQAKRWWPLDPRLKTTPHSPPAPQCLSCPSPRRPSSVLQILPGGSPQPSHTLFQLPRPLSVALTIIAPVPPGGHVPPCKHLHSQLHARLHKDG